MANTITGKPSSFHCGPEIQEMKLNNKWTKQVKNPNWQEADQLAIYKGSQEVEPGTTWLKSSWWSERDICYLVWCIINIICQLFKVIMLTRFALTILELNWNQCFRGKNKIENLSSYAHLFHITAKQVISSWRKNEIVCKMYKNDKCMCKACKIKLLFFIVKYANSWRSCCFYHCGCLSSLLFHYRSTGLWEH